MLTGLSLAGQGTLLGDRGGTGILVENCRSLSTPLGDFAPALQGDKLVFFTRPDRNRATGRAAAPAIYSAPLAANGSPGPPQPFVAPGGPARPNGSICFARQGRVLFFTATPTDYPTGTTGTRAGDGLFSVGRDGPGWGEAKPLPFNDPAFDNRQPSVTRDGRRIFFASDRPGGYGGYDLYFADYDSGSWGKAINLGPQINTAGNDAYPFIHASGQLFFSSDGRAGAGGYDVYRIDVGGRKWGSVTPLPLPINSSADDVGFQLSESAAYGYLASNRPGGLGEEDLYRVTLREGLTGLRTSRSVARGLTVYDAGTSKRLAGTYVWASPITPAGRVMAGHGYFARGDDGNILQRPLLAEQLDSRTATPTGLDGRFPYTFTPGTSYRISVRKDGYAPRTFIYREGKTHPSSLGVGLEAERGSGTGGNPVARTAPADYNGGTLQLPEISYPYLSANPIVEQSPDLDVLYAFLSNNPGTQVLLVVHADGPQADDLLARLTEERGARLRRYLIERGVAADRVKSVGYGNRIPERQCITCTEEDYRANTRIVAKVINWE